MSRADCLALVRVPDPGAVDAVRARVDRLASWFAPLGQVRSAQRWLARPGVLVVALRFGSAPPDPKRTLSWGDDLPVALRDTAGLLGAGDDALRRLGGPLLAIAATEDGARVVTAADGPVAGYRAAGGGDLVVWCTHAVPAALLAGRTPSVDPLGLLEQTAFGFPSGARTLVDGVAALDPATVVDVARDGAVSTRSAWPLGGRWEPLEPEEARREAPERMLAALERRLERSTRPVVGLTPGINSRTIGQALVVLGKDTFALTVADPGSEDLAGARRTAVALGLPHRDLLPREPAPERLDRFVRWSDGLLPGFAQPGGWPAGVSHLVLGAGGGTARALDYRWTYPGERPPRTRQQRDALLVRAQDRIGAPLPHLAATVESWIEEARSTGFEGWAVLDVVFSHQRLRRGGRAKLPPGGPAAFGGLADAHLQPALASLPVEDKRTDGFQRRFLLQHNPPLSPVLVPPKPRPLASPLARARLGALARAKGLRKAAGRATGPDGLAPLVLELATGDAARGLFGEAFGDAAWGELAAERAGRGDEAAWEALLAATGALLLARALADA